MIGFLGVHGYTLLLSMDVTVSVGRPQLVIVMKLGSGHVIGGSVMRLTTNEEAVVLLAGEVGNEKKKFNRGHCCYIVTHI